MVIIKIYVQHLGFHDTSNQGIGRLSNSCMRMWLKPNDKSPHVDFVIMVSKGEHGVEFNTAFTYFVIYLGLFFTGAGKYSLDAKFLRK